MITRSSNGRNLRSKARGSHKAPTAFNNRTRSTRRPNATPVSSQKTLRAKRGELKVVQVQRIRNSRTKAAAKPSRPTRVPSAKTAASVSISSVSQRMTTRSGRTSIPSMRLVQQESTSSQPSRKRKADEPDRTTEMSKRRRGNVPDDVSNIRALAERLKEEEKEIDRRKAAATKREDTLQRREETHRQRANALRTEQSKTRKLQKEIKELTAKNNAQEKLLQEQKDIAVIPAPVDRTPVDVRWVLSQLEDQFQCSLCFEVMACPYQLNHGQCGHTFCALCLLRWCFAALHSGCGHWHDPLECPLCRAELPFAPEATPRPMCTFPFVPSRLADSTIKMLLGVLKDAANGKGACAGGKREESVMAWGENGNARVEWEGRDTRGKAEMVLLAENWINVRAEDFIAIKERVEGL